jgi:hypothetical protein
MESGAGGCWLPTWLPANVALKASVARPWRVLTAPSSGHRIMINGHALCAPLAPFGQRSRSTRNRTGALAATSGRTTWTAGGQLSCPGAAGALQRENAPQSAVDVVHERGRQAAGLVV